jgi:hypothetical protein
MLLQSIAKARRYLASLGPQNGTTTSVPVTLLNEIVDRLMEIVVDVVLYCPSCGRQHIDKPDPTQGWMNPPHKSHLCLHCNHIWRPSDWCTNGVEAIQTKGEADSAPVVPVQTRRYAAVETGRTSSDMPNRSNTPKHA